MASPLLDLFAPLDPSATTPVIVRGGVVETTHGALAQEVRRLATVLRDAGVAPGDRVSVQVDKHPGVLALYLATLWCGGVFHPMNPAYASDEAEFLLADAAPSLIVRSLDSLNELGDATASASPMGEAVDRSPDDLAALLYTSGTTGRPKGAMITHGNLASNAAALVEMWGITANDVLLHVLPVFHAHGLFVACNTSLLAGVPIVWHDRFDAAAAVAAIAGRSGDPVRPTLFMGVPTHYGRLLQEPSFDRSAVAEMRLFVSGSAPLSATMHEAFEARTGHPILERYGMTETQMITSNPLHGDRVAGTVGYPLPGVEVRIDEPAADGVGGVEVRGPNVCAGYWRQPGRRAADFTADGWFRTGDTGRLGPDGRLTLVGRSKDLIISGGYNVYPAEVERVLDAIEGVAESAVVGMPHADFGEAVLAVIVPAADALLDPVEVVATARADLAGYKVPRLVVLVDDLPRNAMGKVQKNVLREQYREAWAVATDR